MHGCKFLATCHIRISATQNTIAVLDLPRSPQLNAERREAVYADGSTVPTCIAIFKSRTVSTSLPSTASIHSTISNPIVIITIASLHHLETTRYCSIPTSSTSNAQHVTANTIPNLLSRQASPLRHAFSCPNIPSGYTPSANRHCSKISIQWAWHISSKSRISSCGSLSDFHQFFFCLMCICIYRVRRFEYPSGQTI